MNRLHVEGNGCVFRALRGLITATLENKLEWFATFRGRAGYTFTPTVLGYVTGGLAVGGVNGSGTITGFNSLGVPVASTFSGNDTQVGRRRRTGKIEYLYLDLGRFNNSAVLLTKPRRSGPVSVRTSPTTSCASASTTASASRSSRNI